MVVEFLYGCLLTFPDIGGGCFGDITHSLELGHEFLYTRIETTYIVGVGGDFLDFGNNGLFALEIAQLLGLDKRPESCFFLADGVERGFEFLLFGIYRRHEVLGFASGLDEFGAESVEPVIVKGIELLFESVDFLGIDVGIGHSCNFLNAVHYILFSQRKWSRFGRFSF